MVTIATWNVNSVRARADHLVDWLRQAEPDIVCLQELKSTEDTYPADLLAALGYRSEMVGQKSYNGVAIVSKDRAEVTHARLPGDSEDHEARYIEALVGPLRVASIYLPNGNPVDSEKFGYKLGWMRRLYEHVQSLLAKEEALILAGDFNVCLTDDDVYDPVGFAEDALCRPESRAQLRSLLYLGLTDALRVFHPELGVYTYWDYQAGRWNRDEGLRIDHLLLSPQAADRLSASGVDKEPRKKNKPSDHTPVWCTLDVS